ncbi:MAG TPA: hypothetical protein VIA18_26395, partial [Polyangia bacterium]|nr:hypothetical protein [Polyangia bacterium]
TTDDCSGAAKLIYVVDENMTLYSFTPNQTDITQSTFATIGNISCPGAAAPGSWEAFSMGVDRNATAWVELQDTFAGVPIGTGTSLFSVSTADASCTATSFTPGAQGFDEFGMGFATNGAMSTDETLYIFGGASVDGTSSSSLGSLDTTSMNVTSLASNLTGSPELTGNALGDLWGFFPDTGTKGSGTSPYIGQIDKTTGVVDPATKVTLTLPTAQASAWAFAFYGGDFFIFYATGTGNTIVYQVSNGALKATTLQTDKLIVGAGVSTCAPVIPIS